MSQCAVADDLQSMRRMVLEAVGLVAAPAPLGWDARRLPLASVVASLWARALAVGEVEPQFDLVHLSSPKGLLKGRPVITSREPVHAFRFDGPEVQLSGTEFWRYKTGTYIIRRNGKHTRLRQVFDLSWAHDGWDRDFLVNHGDAVRPSPAATSRGVNVAAHSLQNQSYSPKPTWHDITLLHLSSWLDGANRTAVKRLQ